MSMPVGSEINNPVEQINSFGDSPLSLACRDGNLKAVETLLANGKGDIAHRNEFKETALHIAAGLDDSSILSLLLSRMENNGVLLEKNAIGETALHIAARAGNVEAIKLLGIFEESQKAISVLNDISQSPIQLAALSRSGEVVKELMKLDNTGDIATQVDQMGNTALHLAALAGNAEGMRYLLSQPNVRAQLSNANNQNESVLHSAVGSGDLKAVEFILEQIDDPKSFIGMKTKLNHTPIHFAAKVGNPDILSLLLKKADKSNILEVDHFGESILHMAAVSGNAKTLEIILEIEGAATLLNKKDNNGYTPLDLASIYCETEALTLMIKAANPKMSEHRIAALTSDKAIEGYRNNSFTMESFKNLTDSGVELFFKRLENGVDEKPLNTTKHLSTTCNTSSHNYISFDLARDITMKRELREMLETVLGFKDRGQQKE